MPPFMTIASALLLLAPFAPLRPGAPLQAPGEGEADTGISLTVYSSADPIGFDPQPFMARQRLGYDTPPESVPGFGVVKEVRSLTFPEGVSAVSFTDVAAHIDPTTVSFTDLSGDGTTVLEQNFRFDLVGPRRSRGDDPRNAAGS